MAGTLTVTTINGVSTLNAPSGVLATQNGMTGICKAWVSYNATTQTIRNSFNVSSVTYNGTGDYTVNFTTAMPSAEYSVGSMTTSTGLAAPVLVILSSTAPTASSIRVNMGDTVSLKNVAYNCINVFA